MRTLRVLGATFFLGAFATSAAAQQTPSPKPQAPSPVFRAGVELVSIDVTALDGNGKQVTDLTAGDFQVEIDGEKRQVATVEYVKSVDPLRAIGEPVKVALPDETYSSSNAKGAQRGRLIMILVDQGNIRTGAARSSMNSAKKFVDTLAPEDRVAVVAVPGPGELVDFTNDHDKVRESLLRIVGTGDPLKGRFNISLTESMALYMHSDQRLAEEVLQRECATVQAQDLDRCERDVQNDAAEIVTEIRRRTEDSLRGMRAVFQGLAAIEGPKAVILVSEGLIFEGLGNETDELAALAADARASLDVMLLDVPRFDATQASQPRTPREDRELQTFGLEQLAGASRGELYRINTTAAFAFDKISHALDGYYLLGVESRPDDRNGKRHRVGVKTSRRGVSIRSRRSFLTSISAKATTPADAVTRALKSPLPINDLPLKMSSWISKQPGGSKIRVLVAAEVERLAEQPLDYTVGMAVVNKDGRGVAPPVTTQKLTPKAGDDGTAVYSGMMEVDPGEYRVILSMADSEGRVGSVARRVTAFQLDGAGVSMGDLMVAGADAAGGTIAIKPAIEPVVSGPIAAVMEAYSGAGLDGLDATLEILADENSAPIAASPMRIAAGPSPEIATASVQFDTTALPPGRYLARGTIRQGGKPQGHSLRPFRIVAANTASGAVTMITGDMAMVFLGGLSNFDRKELLAPAMVTSMLAMAESRPTASKAALKEARSGDLTSAAMTALADNDQALATFLKGLELYQAAQLDKAAMQFQNSMQMAPAFTPSRLYLGAALAEGNRHKEAAGLIQSASSAPPNAAIARIAGEEWLKAAQPALAIPPLELAVQQATPEPRAQKALGLAYVLAGRSTDAVAVLAPYLATNPNDTAALLAAMYGTYNRHLTAAQADTLTADRANMAKWSKAYVTAKGPLQPLVATWVKHVQEVK